MSNIVELCGIHSNKLLFVRIRELVTIKTLSQRSIRTHKVELNVTDTDNQTLGQCYLLH